MPEKQIEKQIEEQAINKPKKRRYSIIFWLALLVFAYFAGKYLLSELHYKKAKENAQNQFPNIEAEIYQTPVASEKAATPDEKPLNQSEILLKQQLQITELQNGFNALKLDFARLKTNESLAKIILSFVKLQDLAFKKQNYDFQLQKLEMLARADFALVSKIEKLKTALQTRPKSQQELSGEFADLVVQIKARKIEIESENKWGGAWLGKLKATISKFIIIKRTDEITAKSPSDLTFISQNIENKQYEQALQNLSLIGNDYQEILTSFKTDLQNAAEFQKINDEIYRYLEMLSNDS